MTENSNVTEVKTEIYKALFKFQGLVKPIGKEATNPFYKSKYSTLDAIQEAIKQPLIDSGLIIVQGIDETGQMKTEIIHVESGTSVHCYFPMVVKNPTSQEYGSSSSYAKRYSIAAILNLTIGGEDDDGNKASHSDNGKPAAKLTEPPTAERPKEDTRPWLSETDYRQALYLINHGETDKAKEMVKPFRMKKEYREELNKAADFAKAMEGAAK